MNPSTYYHHTLGQNIDLSAHGCELAQWQSQYGRALFSRHSNGFLVFVPPTELGDSDEFRDGDPYETQAHIDSDFQRRRIECTLELLKQAVGASGRATRILDLGCGQGHLTGLMLRDHPRAEVCGLDYSISAIDYAASHFPGIEFVVASAYDSPYARDYFDIVVCNNLWEHVSDPLRMLQRIKAVIRPGGFLILSTPSRFCLGNLLRVIRGRPVELASRLHVTEYTVGQVIEQLRYGGMRVLRAYSRPLRPGGLKARLAKLMLSTLISITGSHHVLETTVFYLAQRHDRASN